MRSTRSSDACFQECGAQALGRANPHAFLAENAGAQKLLFGQSARRPDDGPAPVEPNKGHDRQANRCRGKTKDGAAARETETRHAPRSRYVSTLARSDMG